MKEKVNVVRVDWLDADTYSGWHRPENDFVPCICISVGVLEKESNEFIRIKQSQSLSGNVAESITIPKVCIKKIKRIKL